MSSAVAQLYIRVDRADEAPALLDKEFAKIEQSATSFQVPDLISLRAKRS
jgi:hypothetical protein